MTWCYVPGTEFPSAQAVAALNSGCTLPSRVSLAAAMLKPMRTPRPFLWATWRVIRWTSYTPSLQLLICLIEILRFHSLRPSADVMPDLSNRPRCGPTCGHSSGMHGPDTLTSSVRGIPASRSAPPETVLAGMIRDTSGQTSPGSTGKPAHLGGSSKTSQDTSASALRPCCETYGTWAQRLRWAYSARAKQAARTKDSASSSWPTAVANDDNKSLQGHLAMKRRMVERDGTNANRTAVTSLQVMATNWQTPVADDRIDRAKGKINSRGEPKLSAQAQMWGTPRGSDGEKGGPNQSFGAGGTPLPAQAANWPTPASRDHKGENGPEHLINGTGRLHMDQLPNAVAHSFRHPAPEKQPSGVTSCDWRPISRRLLRSATLSVGRTTLRRWLRKGAWRRRRLNPIFVEWLMRWPPGHGLCECTETEWTLWLQHMRGALSALPTASAPWIWQPPADFTEPTQGSLFDDV